MATVADIEAALQADYTVDVGSPKIVSVDKSEAFDATYTNYYITSRASDMVNKSGWVRATTADAAADQADEIRAALLEHAPTVNVGP